MLMPYPGVCPSNVNKDAKYSVRGSSGRMEVRLVYQVSQGERELLTTDRHDELVDKVNAVKLELNGTPGGAFYINEYHDVLVPGSPHDGCMFAGVYDPALKFDYEGQEVSPVPSTSLTPGLPWSGPHVGIRYVLAAGAADIKREHKSGQTITTEYLSEFVGSEPARTLAHRLAAVKGHAGGRIYINEASVFFAPLNHGASGVSYAYLGPLEDDAWFPAPDVPGRQ